MKDLFASIAKANSDSQGRVRGAQYAIVADIDDPLNLNRIKVLEPAKGARSTSDWLFSISPLFGLSLPVPPIGTTVLVSYIDGNPHHGVYLGAVVNIKNKPSSDRNVLRLALGDLVVTLTPEGALDFNGVTSFTINGKEVATVGAKDSRNDTLTTKGY
jgi:Type VI secretion system/phage-baseplate injector OB domain